MFRIAAVWFSFTDGAGLPDIPLSLDTVHHVVGREDSKFTRDTDFRVGGSTTK